MFQVELDKSKNVLKLAYSRHVGPDETQACEERIKVLLPDLQPGFQLLSDLSGLEEMEIACVPYIRRIMELCKQSGVGRIMRVIPDPRKDIGLNILSLFHYPRDLPILTFATLAEATAALEA
jgi:hypothetical protein